MPEQSLTFRDRADAGQRLAKALPSFDPLETVVVALPRGGVPVAAEICAQYDLPMDLVLVRKIGAPGNPELAIGAVTDGPFPHVTVNRAVARMYELTDSEVEAKAAGLLPEIERRRSTYLGERAPVDLSGKTVLVVDDGAATGTTLLASLEAIKTRNPQSIVVVLPVAPKELVGRLQRLAHEVVCLRDLGSLGAVGAAYQRFDQVDDSTVRACLDRFPHKQSEADNAALRTD